MAREKCKVTGKSRFPTPGEAKEAMTSLKSTKRYYDTTGKRIHKDRVESTKTLVKNKEEAAEWMKDSLPFPETKTNNNEMV